MHGHNCCTRGKGVCWGVCVCELTQYARNEPKAHFVEVSKFSFKLRLSHTHTQWVDNTNTHVNLVGRQEMTVIAIAFACTHTHTHTHEERVSFGSFLHHNYER